MSLFIHKTILGDTAKCAVYLPFALSKVRYLYQIKSVQTQSFEIDGIKIRCHVVGDQGFVRLDGGCFADIEAGALELGSTSCTYIESVKSCAVYKDGVASLGEIAGVSVTPLPVDDPAHSENPQYTSKVFRLKEPATPLPIMPVPKLEDYWTPMGNPDYCGWRKAMYPDQAELRDKKLKLEARLNPSKYTGKMRMFMQAIVGCKNVFDRIKTQRFPDGQIIEYLDNYLPLEETNYIVRDTAGEYWMFFSGKTYVWRMLFHSCADRAKVMLRAGGLTREEESKLEAVLFSFVYVDQHDQAFIDAYYEGDFLDLKLPPPPPSAVAYTWPVAYGSAYEYDWHFAYQKPTALRVGHISKPTENPLDPNEWIAHAQMEEITFFSTADVAGEPQPPTASLRLLEQSDWSYMAAYNAIWLNVSDYHWIPVPYDHPADGACDAPIYAFYGAKDEHVIVRYKKSEKSAEDELLLDEDYGSCEYGTQSSGRKILAGSLTGGFYVTRDGATVWDGVGAVKRESSSYAIKRWIEGEEYLMDFNGYVLDLYKERIVIHNWELLTTYTGTYAGYYVGQGCGALDSSYGTSGSIDIISNRITFRIHEKTEYETEPLRHGAHSVVMFPTDNPDAVFVGLKQEVEYQNTVDHATMRGGLTHVETQFWHPSYPDDPTHMIGSAIETIPFSSASMNYDGVDYGEPWVTDTYVERKLERVQDISLIAQLGEHTLSHTETMYLKKDGDVYSWIDATRNHPWQAFVAPPRAMTDKEDYPEYRFNARESINGKLWYVSAPGTQPNNVAKTNFEVNNPDDTSGYFTGWA